MRILTRYVTAELVKVFVVSLTALTMMMIVVGVVREALAQQLPAGQVVRLIPYILPDALRMTVPVTFLLACTTVYARMAGANEVVAVKALGISPTVLLWPAFFLAFALSLGTVWLNDLAVSWGRNGVQRVVLEAVEEIIYSMLQSQRRYSSSYFAINVKRVEGHRLLRPTLTLQGRGNSPAATITAEEAELQADQSAGVLKIILRNGSIDVAGKVKFEFPNIYEQEIPLNEASRARDSQKLPSCLALSSIHDEIEAQRATIAHYEQEMAAEAAYEMLCGDFDESTGGDWAFRAIGRADQSGRLCRLLTEPHRRWSAGFSCLCFIWVGAPMAIRLRNRDFLTSFFLCFLPILVVYYPLLAYGVDGAKSGTIPPYSVWAGNLLLILWGTWLLRRVIRY
jgi:lipopolysaccharide export system permease protein